MSPPPAQPAQAAPVQFNFGVEIETRTGSKTHQHKAWLPLATDVSQELLKKGIPNHLIKSMREKSEEKYQEWSLIQDTTVFDYGSAHRYSLELVSPVLSHADSRWLSSISDTWSVLNTSFVVEKGVPQTSTHIHLSPKLKDGWPTALASKLAIHGAYYERSIDSLVPILRRANIWCQSNRHNAKLRSLNMPDIFSKLNSCTSTAMVASYMNMMSKDSSYGKQLRKTADFTCAYFRWNFTSCQSGKGTVEFRQPPGSDCKEDTLTWITFAVLFATAAVTGPVTVDPKKEPASLAELKNFLQSGAVAANVTKENWLLIEKLFHGKTLLPAGKYAYDVMDTSEKDLELMMKKATDKDITLEKFKKLYGYK